MAPDHILFPLNLDTGRRRLTITDRADRTHRLAIHHQARLHRLTIGLDAILLFLFIVTSLILRNTADQVPHENPDNQHKPEDVDRLQDREQGRSDGLRDPALVLLRVPVELVRPDSCELAVWQQRPDDA